MSRLQTSCLQTGCLQTVITVAYELIPLLGLKHKGLDEEVVM